ncbi:hypothetical protein BT93_L2052 [Corymbia citriodora subsp. variegata]|uniref:Magnesium transporter n=1 Tax=Corymbia citriodora subsp. variegata TaxID=360336 RepID=A0A8T0CQP6_CORYI|nr:hypothetical protein BT93_L2052 [Corymbia citriodora subsp. variegata]
MPSGHLPMNPKGDLEPNPPQMPAAHLMGHRLRKKGIGIKTWLVVDSTGQAQHVDARKHLIRRRTGLSARDLRILDPSLSYPSTVTGRERAVVIKLEHIKGVITAKDVWLLNSKDPAVAPFVEELKRRCSHHHQANAVKIVPPPLPYRNITVDRLSEQISPGKMSIGKVNRSSGGEEQSEEAVHQIFEATQGEGLHSRIVKEQHDTSETLPFEFVALEACLEAACSSLDDEAKALEQEANPALDKLISKISTRHLERVRQIKARLVLLTGRVQKIRNEIEHLLEDDGDMAEMYLTRKLQQDEEDKSSSSSISEEKHALHEPDEETQAFYIFSIMFSITGRIISNLSLCFFKAFFPLNHAGITKETIESRQMRVRVLSASRWMTMKRQEGSKHLDVAELEMLLEAYFVQLDGTLNELSVVRISKSTLERTQLREYIQDTEDYVNIMLDDKQNNLLQMGVVISTATMFITMFIVVTGIFGMNVRIFLFLNPNPKINNFLWTVSGCTFGTIVLYAIAIAWYKYKRFI